MSWKGRCRETKDTRSIIARVACTFFAQDLLDMWWFGLVMLSSLVSIMVCCLGGPALSAQDHILDPAQFLLILEARKWREDIHKFCSRFLQKEDRRKTSCLSPFVLRESTGRLRSLVLFDVLLSKSRRSSIVLFGPDLEFGASRRKTA